MPALASLSAQPPATSHGRIPRAARDWLVLDTLHFRIHYPEGHEALARRAAQYAERSHARLTRVLAHRMRAVIPVFVFASHQDFSAANILDESPGEATGGYTDFFRRRVVVPFDGNYANFRHVLAHEIVHAFQFEILPGPFYGAFPLWLTEGMAEYLSLGWDSEAEAYVRDLVLHDRLPGLRELTTGGAARGYDSYKVGQALVWYIARRYGEERVGFFLKELAITRDLRAACSTAFALAPEELDFAFHADLAARYAPAQAVLAGRPKDPRARVASYRYDPQNEYSDRTGYHLRPALSPDGRRIAYITASGPFPAIAIKPAPGPAVSAEQVRDVTIVLRALRGPEYEEYQPLTTRLAWSPDGRRLLVAGRRAGHQALLIIDVERGAVVGSVEPDFDAIQYPALAPDGKSVIFTGVRHARADLYLLTLSAGGIADDEVNATGLVRLTDDDCHESEARLSSDGRHIYYSANCAPEPGSVSDATAATGSTAGTNATNSGDGTTRHLYRLTIADSSAARTGVPPLPQQLTALPGQARAPQPAHDGSLVFVSDFTGVANAYRLEKAAEQGAPPAGEGDPRLSALTRSPTGIEDVSLVLTPGEHLVYTERAEGAREIMLLPPGIDASGQTTAEPERISAVEILPPSQRTYDAPAYRSPLAPAAGETSVPPEILSIGDDYVPRLSFAGAPWLVIGGGSDADGETSVAGLAVAELADDTGNHRVFALAGYGESAGEPETVYDLRYSYLKLRPDLYAGLYRQSGAAPAATIFQWNLNDFLYSPYYRVLEQESYGVYAGVDYPLSRFQNLGLTLEYGRDEIEFRAAREGEREREDIAIDHYEITAGYRFDNMAYGRYGALDGQILSLAYAVPLRPRGTERELYTLQGDYRLAHWISDDWIFAARAHAAGAGGQDAIDYPFGVGGYASIRGYDFQEFEGRYAFFWNLELRFPVIRYLTFALPVDWSPGGIRGVVFFDGGSAFDEPDDWQGYVSRERRTRDLHLSYGAGIHWQNFLWFVIPGAIMKIEWATPYDLKVSEPPRKWRGNFSVGFGF